MTHHHGYTPNEERRALDAMLADIKAHECVGSAFMDAADGLDASVVARTAWPKLRERIARQREEQEAHDYPHGRCCECGGRMDREEGSWEWSVFWGVGRWDWLPGGAACEDCGHWVGDEREDAA